VLRSAAAQYVNLGNQYATSPTSANEEAMKNAEKIMGHAHSQLKKMMDVHTKGGHSVNKSALYAEQAAAHKEVLAWKGQIELMQIDASSFVAAYQRLSRANKSIFQNLVSDPTRKDQLDKQQTNWNMIAQRYADLFEPPESQKWLATDVFADEDKVFSDLAKLQSQISSL
jgi:hypothetical protein